MPVETTPEVQAAAVLRERRDSLAAALTERTFAAFPELLVRYGKVGHERCMEDAHFHLRYLAEAVERGRPSLFGNYVAWAKVMLEERRVPAEDLHANLTQLAGLLRSELGPVEGELAASYVDAALAQLPAMPTSLASHIDASTREGAFAARFLQALLDGDRVRGSAIVHEAMGAGMSLRDVYLGIFQQSQREVGRLWQANKISVAHEHFCTAATQVIMSQLYPLIFTTPRVSRRFVATCVGGELHEIGMRMVADFFEMAGWDTYYLGANVPSGSLVRLLEERRPDVLGISATIAFHIAEVEEIIRAVRAHPIVGSTRIIVGGYPFLQEPALWRDLGADGFAADASQAVELANGLVE